MVIEQSIALRHTEQSSALEFENRRLHAELTPTQNMLADRKAIEERNLDIHSIEEHVAVIRPPSKPNDSEETILFGVVGLLALTVGASR